MLRQEVTKGRIDLRMIVFLSLILLSWSCTGESVALTMTEFAGEWQVDLDRTFEEAKKSPKFDAESADGLPDALKKLMGMMRIEISPTEIVYLRGSQRQALPYELASSDPSAVTVSVRQGADQAELVFAWIDDDRMNFKSSVSDDMDYYVWERVHE